MTTYNTRNPIGSIDARDLYDNAQNLDNAVNGAASRWTDRLGVSRPSWAGMISYVDQGAYGAMTITGYNEIFLHEGEYYRAAAATTLPYTITGSWSDDGAYFVPIGDANLRSELAAGTFGGINGEINVSYFGTLEEARTNSEAAGMTIVVTTPLTEAQSNITAAWPTDRALKVEKGGSIGNTTTFAFASGAAFSAGEYTVFAGAVSGLRRAKPEWFSPVVVGSSDNTAAIQKAGDALVEYGVLQLDGNYIISQIGVGVDFNGKTNFTVRGTGKVTTPAAALSSRPFVIRNSSFVEVSGVTFECLIPLGVSAQPCNGLDIMNTTDAYIHDCKFIGQTFYGLGVYQDTIGGTDGSCAGLRVTDNLFQDIGTLGFEPFPKVIAGTALISRNKFVNCGNNKVGTGNAGAFKAGNGFETVIVEDNIIDNCGGSALGYGVGMAGWSDISFTGNKFYRCAINLTVSTGAHTLGEEGTFERMIIARNIFGTTTTSSSMVVLTHLAGSPYDSSGGSVIFENNQFLSNNTASISGMEFKGAGVLANLFILDNKFRGIATYPINLNNADGGTFTNPVVSGNTFIATDPTRILSDIKIDNTASAIVQGNTHINSGEYALRLTNATGTVHVIGNKYINGNVTSIATRGPITTIGPLVCTYNLDSNIISGGTWAALVVAASANHTLTHSKNIAPKIATTSTPTRVAAEMMGAITANADAAITGYITIIDQV